MIYTVIMILDRDFCESEGFHKRGYPNSWMVFVVENPMKIP